ncbi:hypothetical protein [Rhodomicrobium lacus]|uniref:hypothetical protein n=1 Tax=Rhodomicrobium lacus TaxID=2498452 RepID=UPI000F8CF283|nr:hypothetical protein [Rhodomicrobium lacus]
MARTKEIIDIEKLLDWAYRVQKVDRQAAGGFSARGPQVSTASVLGATAVLGVRVDNSGFAARTLGAVSRSSPDDALIAHDAVLSLADMWLEWADLDQVEIWDRERLDREGQIVEQRNGAWWRVPAVTFGNVEPLPVRVEQACSAVLVIVHAKAGTRPEAYEDWAEAVTTGNRGGRGRKSHIGATSAEEVMHARAVYLVWHAALATLAAQLDGALEGFEVTGPDVPAEPWIEAKQAKRVLEGDFVPMKNARKPLKQKRKK